MSVVVFTGPTLSAEDARAAETDLAATYLPPVSQGDVYTAAREKPWGIAIIDGYFERVPAVWHKEILWAMSRGVHVFGGASMGALRAAELETFGMEGVGRIFEAFRDGDLTDDDEVAVTHGPAESGYRALSEAMVNIRWTLASAAEHRVIDEEARKRLIGIAKGLFYPHRSWPRVLGLYEERVRTTAVEEIEALRAWLPAGRVDRKGLDAVELLGTIRERRATNDGRKKVRFTFQHTDAWDEVRRSVDRRSAAPAPGTETSPRDGVLVEARLEGEPYRLEREKALVRSLGLDVARQEGLRIEGDTLRESVEALRLDLGLHQAARFEEWKDEQRLADDDFVALVRDEARVRRIRTMVEADLDRQLPDQLRVGSRYGRLAERARRKQLFLAERGLDNPGLEDAEVGEAELWRWYFEDRLGGAVPDDLDAYAVEFDFADVDGLRLSVLREYCYLTLEGGESS